MRVMVVLMIAVLSMTPTYTDPSLWVSSTIKSISVHGSASVRLRPDRVSFAVGVESRAATVAEAFKANKTGVNAVLAALRQNGVAPEEIQTSSFDINTIPADEARPRAFRLVSNVTVTSSDTGSVGDLLQAAEAAGASQVGGLGFSVANPAAQRKQGLERAIQDARSKADTLTTLAKETLGDVLCVTDESVDPVDEMTSRPRSLGYVGGLGAESGSEELGFEVSAVFELE